MRIGLSYDLKTTVNGINTRDDTFEEYDSPETIEYLSDAFESRGYEVVRLGGGVEFLDRVRQENVDIVFNISEGRGAYRSREAQVPAVLEMLGIPYTGSDPQCLAICLDKPIAKKLVASEGIATPGWLVISSEMELELITLKVLKFPVIVKPAYEGSSKGIRLTSVAHDIAAAIKIAGKLLNDYHQPVMVEEFIDGDEVTVGVIGNSPPKLVGMMRILPKKKEEHFVYSLEVKRDYVNRVDYESPIRLPDDTLRKLETSSLNVFRILGCRDLARVDFRVGRDGIPYFIEINPLPGLGTYSDLIIMASMLGWTHRGLINAVLDAALERYLQCVSV